MIVQHVSREKHPRDLHHVVRYGDLEAVVPVGERQKVYLSVQFTGSVVADPPEHRQSQRAGRKKAGDSAGEEYVQLGTVQFHPRAERVIDPEGCPWADDEAPTVVFAELHPIPRKVSEWFPQLRSAVADVLKSRVGTLTRKGLPSARWLLHVGFLPESGSLEVGITTWTDLRKNDEQLERLQV
ncbi:MAG: hypothetical protein KC502_15500 [Myxococcales bacterium]|nr:hypothetical protein [Myxococcales bacterium]